MIWAGPLGGQARSVDTIARQIRADWRREPARTLTWPVPIQVGIRPTIGLWFGPSACPAGFGASRSDVVHAHRSVEAAAECWLEASWGRGSGSTTWPNSHGQRIWPEPTVMRRRVVLPGRATAQSAGLGRGPRQQILAVWFDRVRVRRARRAGGLRRAGRTLGLGSGFHGSSSVGRGRRAGGLLRPGRPLRLGSVFRGNSSRPWCLLGRFLRRRRKGLRLLDRHRDVGDGVPFSSALARGFI